MSDPRVRQNLALVVGLQGALVPKRTGSRGSVSPSDEGTPMSLICGRCWRCRTAGSSLRLPSNPWSG